MNAQVATDECTSAKGPESMSFGRLTLRTQSGRVRWPMRIFGISVETLVTTGAQQEATPHKEKPDVINQYNFLTSWLKAHTKSERGAAMVEYALLVALIAIVAIAALQVLGGQVTSNFDNISSSLSDAEAVQTDVVTP